MGERPLVGIVPNFSEGRREDVIDAIVGALLVPGVVLLNRQGDPDHNRLDCTLVGDPDAVRRSALSGAAKAVELIDMEEHRGSHPRMGAVDVIPFMPVRGISMDECVELARVSAHEIAETLGIPVYCYDRAALSPERTSLAEVRRGEYEGLRADVAAGERLPDFGPRELGRAGAVAVGARKPLIAFNVYLSGGDEEAAKEIARAVRESSGGLAHVRAIGFAVPERGCVEVSMNLVDHDVTPIQVAFRAVHSEAGRRRMDVLDSEIVGLVPQSALDAVALDALRLAGFDPGAQVLERAVERAEIVDGPGGRGDGGFRSLPLDGFLEALAGSAPTPGGGSAAAIAGATGAALVSMVCSLTIGKKAYADAEPRMLEILERTTSAREELLALADRDAEAFEAVMAAFKLPKGSEEDKAARAGALQAAFAAAADVPLGIARLAVDVLQLALQSVQLGNPNAASDGAAAAQMLAASARSATYNVEINLTSLTDANLVGRLRGEVDVVEARTAELLAAANTAFHERLEGASP